MKTESRLYKATRAVLRERDPSIGCHILAQLARACVLAELVAMTAANNVVFVTPQSIIQ